jgi:hypothetical protein
MSVACGGSEYRQQYYNLHEMHALSDFARVIIF